MIIFQNITSNQAARLEKLHRLISRSCRESYTLKAAFYTVPGRKGCFSYICRDSATSERISRLVRSIAPSVKLQITSGTGWHYLDSTPHYVGALNFQII